jgi:16S rRNA (uracil1498-N3)-methyltransferase
LRNFFYDGTLTLHEEIQFSGRDFADELKHMTKVLRLQSGQKIGLVNGRGLLATAEILELHRELASLKIIEVKESIPPVRLHLCIAPLKGPRMDWLVEKITELGVASLRPVLTEFTVANEENADRAERWLRIAKSAVKQSGSGWIPEIHAPQPLQSAISHIPANSLKIFDRFNKSS